MRNLLVSCAVLVALGCRPDKPAEPPAAPPIIEPTDVAPQEPDPDRSFRLLPAWRTQGRLWGANDSHVIVSRGHFSELLTFDLKTGRRVATTTLVASDERADKGTSRPPRLGDVGGDEVVFVRGFMRNESDPKSRREVVTAIVSLGLPDLAPKWVRPVNGRTLDPCLSSAGTLIVAGDGAVMVGDSGAEVWAKVLTPSRERVERVACADDKFIILMGHGSSRELRSYSAKNGELLWSQPAVSARSLVVAKDFFVVRGQTIELRELATGTVVHAIEDVSAIAIDPQARWLVAIDTSTYRVLGLRDGSEMWSRPRRDSERYAASLFGDWVVLEESDTLIIHVPTGEIATRLPRGGEHHIQRGEHVVFTNGDPLYAYRIVDEVPPPREARAETDCSKWPQPLAITDLEVQPNLASAKVVGGGAYIDCSEFTIRDAKGETIRALMYSPNQTPPLQLPWPNLWTVNKMTARPLQWHIRRDPHADLNCPAGEWECSGTIP